MSANHTPHGRAVLMIAYTSYESDPRVMREAEAAVAGGYSVDVLALRRAENPAVETVRGVRVLRVNQCRYRGGGHGRYLLAYIEFFLRCFFRSAWLHLRRRYAVIHVNNMPDFLVFSTLIPRLLGAKVILDIHDPMPNTFASKFRAAERGFFFNLLLWQERLSAAYANRVITVHEPVRDGILVKHGLPMESIDVIANFADGEMFPLRTDYRIDRPLRLVFHGTILERSGLRLLAEALARVRHREQVRCRVIGEGDFSEEFRGLIESLGLQSIVEFDNHSYPTRAITGRIVDCHVGVIPLEISSVTNYALPLKLVEYIALGLPVVSVRSAAINHYFKEEDCLFYPWDNPAALAAVIDGLVENPSRLTHYRARSVALRQRFLWDGERRKYIELLHKLSGLAQPASLVERPT
jgi:glycosyltransferase involved in cell wall biosynthesis